MVWITGLHAYVRVVLLDMHSEEINVWPHVV